MMFYGRGLARYSSTKWKSTRHYAEEQSDRVQHDGSGSTLERQTRNTGAGG